MIFHHLVSPWCVLKRKELSWEQVRLGQTLKGLTLAYEKKLSLGLTYGLLKKISLPAPHVSFIPPKNSILPLIKNSVRRNRNFSSSNFRKISVFRNQSWISRQKKIRFIETEFFMKGKIGNSGGKKETWGAGREKIVYWSSFSVERSLGPIADVIWLLREKRIRKSHL
jgi:hypothetical protein